jgi:hypothetical protein
VFQLEHETVIATRSEFESETAWESTVLAIAVPAISLNVSEGDLDLRTRKINLYASTIVCGSERAEELRDALLPLIFGAGWKILDLGLELALAMANLSPIDGKRWRIDEKKRLALDGRRGLPEFSESELCWKAFAALYAGTVKIRHALVHRQVMVNNSTKELIEITPGNTRSVALSHEEQVAFCRFAQRLSQVIIDGKLRPRAELDLLGQLSILSRHHRVILTSKPIVRGPAQIIDDFPGNGILNVPYYVSEAQKTFPDLSYVNIRLHLEDGTVLDGELDEAPQDAVSIDLENLPAWLRFS